MIAPKFEALTLLTTVVPPPANAGVKGSGKNCGWFHVLNVSKRNWRFNLSVKAKSLRMPMSQLLIPGMVMVLRPLFPNSLGAG